MDLTTDEKIALAYATGPTGRLPEVFHMPQPCSKLLAAFVHPPDPVTILEPSEKNPFASPDSSLLPRLLEAYWPLILDYSIESIMDPYCFNLRVLQKLYCISVYGDPDYDKPAVDVTELPEEIQDMIDEWVAEGGDLCGFYLKPPVERLVDWLRGQDTQDDAHPHYCDGCRKYTTNLEPSTGNYCYLCQACVDCGSIHYAYLACPTDEVAHLIAALKMLYQEKQDRR